MFISVIVHCGGGLGLVDKVEALGIRGPGFNSPFALTASKFFLPLLEKNLKKKKTFFNINNVFPILVHLSVICAVNGIV